MEDKTELLAIIKRKLNEIVDYRCTCGAGYALGNCGCDNYAKNRAEQLLDAIEKGAQ